MNNCFVPNLASKYKSFGCCTNESLESVFAAQASCENADITELYFLIVDIAGISRTLVLNKKA